jgi:hypothetical protein
MLYNDPPFDLGETLLGTDDNGDLINEDKLGMIFEFPAYDRGAAQIRGSKKRETGRQVRAVCLRNTSGIILAPKLLVAMEAVAGFNMFHNAVFNITSLS